MSHFLSTKELRFRNIKPQHHEETRPAPQFDRVLLILWKWMRCIETHHHESTCDALEMQDITLEIEAHHEDASLMTAERTDLELNAVAVWRHGLVVRILCILGVYDSSHALHRFHHLRKMEYLSSGWASASICLPSIPSPAIDHTCDAGAEGARRRVCLITCAFTAACAW